MSGQTILYAKPADGQVEVYGAGLARGIWPESPTWNHAATGAEQATVTLKRRADVQWSDLLAGTRVWAMRNGQVGFQGRIRQTPSKRDLAGDTITLQLEGLTANLVDDTLAMRAVTADLNDWVDLRSTAHSDTTADKAIVDAQIGNGIINLQCAKGTAVTAFLTGRVGIVLEAGPNRSWQSLTYAGTQGGLRAADIGAVYSAEVFSSSFSNLGVIVSNVAAGSFSASLDFSSTPTQTIIILFRPLSTATLTNDAWIRFTQLQAFANEAERVASGGGIRASYIVGKALDKCPLVNPSRTRVADTTFAIPHFEGGQQSPLSYIQAANDYHLWQFFLRDGAAGEPPVPWYRPVPTVPTLVARVGQGIEWEDASRGDGSDVYNRVIVQYQDGTGVAQEVVRSTGGLAGISFTQPSAAQIVNATFDADTPGLDPGDWIVSLGSATVANASPAPGSTNYCNFITDAGSLLDASDDVPPGDIVEGRTYQLLFWCKTAVNDAKQFAVSVIQDDHNGQEFLASSVFLYSQAFNAWTPLSMTFLGRGDLSLVKVKVSSVASTGGASRTISIDQFTIVEARPTLWDKQGIIRTKVLATGARMTTTAAAQIGDAFLTAHQRTPLKGTLTVQGSSLRTWLGDVPVPAAVVGARYVQDPVLIVDTDPDLSDTARVGIIAATSYDEANDTVAVQVDQRRDFLDALQARLAVELPT